MSEETTETPTPQTPVAEQPPAATPAGEPPPHRWGELRTELGAAQKRADEASALATKYQQQIEKLKADHKGQIQQLHERGDLLRHGIDDAPGMAAARAAYGETGDDRPESIGAWLDTVKAAASAEENPAPLPRWFAPYVAVAPEAPQAKGGIKSLKQPTQPPPANGAVSDEALRTIMASGDRDALAAALATRGALKNWG